MKAEFTLVALQEAYEDVLRRTLAKLPCDLARLIYLSSMRDYNTGRYHHDGLADRFTPAVAAEALELAHRDIFLRVAALPLEGLIQQMQGYLESSREKYIEVLRTWWRLEPYRVAIPMNVNPTVAALFISNVKLALAILPRLHATDPQHPSGASLLQ